MEMEWKGLKNIFILFALITYDILNNNYVNLIKVKIRKHI